MLASLPPSDLNNWIGPRFLLNKKFLACLYTGYETCLPLWYVPFQPLYS